MRVGRTLHCGWSTGGTARENDGLDLATRAQYPVGG